MAPKSRKASAVLRNQDDMEPDTIVKDSRLQEPVPKKPKAQEEDGESADTHPEDVQCSIPQATYLQRTPSASNHVSSDTHSDRRVMGAAATIGGTAGMLLMGPVSGAALGAAALYATTREDGAGTVARKAGAMYLQMADRAVDQGLRVLDKGIKKVGHTVEEKTRDLDTSSLPAPIRAGLHSLTSGRASQSTRAIGSSEEAQRIREKYPDRVPVICEKSRYADLPEISKSKFVVPGNMLCGEFKYLVHKQIAEATDANVKVAQTIYLFVNGVTPKTSTPMSELYSQFGDDTGFLYISYGAENTLG